MRVIAGLATATFVAVLTTGSASATALRTVPPAPADPSTIETAFALLDNAGYAAALAEPVAGPEDDGGTAFGFDDGFSQRTEARVLSAGGVSLDVLLYAYPDPAIATTQYTSMTQRVSEGTNPEVIADTGDQALYTPGDTFVLRGAQVLEVTVQFTGAAEQQIEDAKSSADPDFVAILSALFHRVVPVLQSAGAMMTGAAVSTPQTLLPAAGKDPCGGQPALAAQIFGGDVSAAASSTERPPWTECVMRAGGESVELLVVTDAQLATSITPSSAADRFAFDLAAAQSRGGAQVSADGRSFTTTAPEVAAEALVTAPSGQTYLVAALVPGSFAASGGEAPFAASLAALATGVPGAIEAPPPPPTTLPQPTTVPAATSTVVAPTVVAAGTATTLVATASSAQPVAVTNAGEQGSSVSSTPAPAGAIGAPPEVSADDVEPSLGAGAPTGSGSSGDSGSSTGVIVLVVVLIVVVAAAGAAVVLARRRRRVAAAPARPLAAIERPTTVGVSGPVVSAVRDLEGSWSIGVAGIPGPTEQTVTMEDPHA